MKKQIKPLPVPKSVELEYYKELRKLVKELKEDVNTMLLPLLRDNSFDSNYTKDVNVASILSALGMIQAKYSNILAFSSRVAESLVNRLNGLGRNKFNKSLEEAYGIDMGQVINENNLGNMVQLIKMNNVSLIKTIPAQFLSNIEQIIQNGITNGLSYKAMEKQIKGIKDISSAYGNLDSRIKTIVRTEVATINSNLNNARAKEAGISLYKWSSSNDERTRTSHLNMHNKICKIDDNTVYADSVEDANNGKWKKRASIGGVQKGCGQDFNCRCSQIYIIPKD